MRGVESQSEIPAIHTVADRYCARGNVLRRHAGSVAGLPVAVGAKGRSSRFAEPR